MIKNKNILILVAVLLVLGAISLVQKSGYNKSTTQSSTIAIVEGTLNIDVLDRITLGQGADETAVELLATPTGWVVASAWDATASSQRIEALLRNLSDLSGEFRSDNESVLADYGLDDDNAVKVRAYDKDGAVKVAVDIGRMPEGSRSCFIKQPGSHAVYLSPTNMLAPLGLNSGPGVPGVLYFLDLQAVQEDRLDIDKIILTEDGASWEMEKVFAEPKPAPGQTDAAADSMALHAEPDRTTWEWKLTAPVSKALAKTKADGVLSSSIAIRAVDVENPATEWAVFGLDAPTRIATLMRQDGTQIVLEFGNKREAVGDHPAGTRMAIHGKDSVWVVTDYTVDNIFKPVEELLPDQE